MHKFHPVQMFIALADISILLTIICIQSYNLQTKEVQACNEKIKRAKIAHFEHKALARLSLKIRYSLWTVNIRVKFSFPNVSNYIFPPSMSYQSTCWTIIPVVEEPYVQKTWTHIINAHVHLYLFCTSICQPGHHRADENLYSAMEYLSLKRTLSTIRAINQPYYSLRMAVSQGPSR